MRRLLCDPEISWNLWEMIMKRMGENVKRNAKKQLLKPYL